MIIMTMVMLITMSQCQSGSDHFMLEKRDHHQGTG